MSAGILKKVHMEPDQGSGSKIAEAEQENTTDNGASGDNVQTDSSQQKQETDPTKVEIEGIETEPEVTILDEQSEKSVQSKQVVETPLPPSDAPEVESAAQDESVTQEATEARFALVRQFSSDYFLNKHSPSFKCLEQYLCSRSDLRLTLAFFPPLADPGLDDALYFIPEKEEPDPNGCDKYINMCKDLTIVPIRRVINSLSTETLNLKYYGLTLKQMRGIASALKVNSNIKYLILEDNWMSPEATSLISEVLRESYSIRVLNLRECRIGEEGSEKLCEGLASTQFLQELDLSFNSLGDKGLTILQPSLIENASIKKLNISHNDLTEESGETLEKILLDNKCLEHLDLSWNGFFTGPGNKKLCNGLTRNGMISWLSLAWNGIGTPGAMLPITRYLRKTQVLEFLDLSWNRVTQRALRLLRSALIKNKSLNEIRVGNNIYTSDEAYFLGSLLTKAKNDLTYLDMENMCVNKDFLPMEKKLERQGKRLSYGHVLSNYEIYGPDINKLIFQRCKYLAMKPKRKKQKKDFGHFILSLPDESVTPLDFQVLMKKKKIKKIDKDLLHELISRFSTKKHNVDCVAMKDAFMKLYPDTVLPEEKKKKKKKKKGKKGKTKKAKKAGEQETAKAGEQETAKAGEQETAQAGEQETAQAGEQETAQAGEQETAQADEQETAKTGEQEPARADEQETTEAGEQETAEAGEQQTATTSEAEQ